VSESINYWKNLLISGPSCPRCECEGAKAEDLPVAVPSAQPAEEVGAVKLLTGVGSSADGLTMRWEEGGVNKFTSLTSSNSNTGALNEVKEFFVPLASSSPSLSQEAGTQGSVPALPLAEEEEHLSLVLEDTACSKEKESFQVTKRENNPPLQARRSQFDVNLSPLPARCACSEGASPCDGAQAMKPAPFRVATSLGEKEAPIQERLSTASRPSSALGNSVCEYVPCMATGGHHLVQK